MELAEKVAIVTGGGSGVGRACALALASRGASVAVLDIDRVGGETTVGAICENGREALFLHVDVSRADQLQAAFQATADTYGRLDIVHNNAGIVSGGPGWPETSAARIERVVAVNLAGAIMGTRLAVEHLRGAGGAVVNTSSMVALGPFPPDPVYAATKAGIVAFTRSCSPLRDLLGIRVNAVLPGLVDTPMILQTGDGLEPAEWARAGLESIGALAPERVADTVLELLMDENAAGEAVTVAADS